MQCLHCTAIATPVMRRRAAKLWLKMLLQEEVFVRRRSRVRLGSAIGKQETAITTHSTNISGQPFWWAGGGIGTLVCCCWYDVLGVNDSQQERVFINIVKHSESREEKRNPSARN